MSRQIGHTGVRHHVTQGELDAEDLLEARQQAHRLEAVATEFEEIGVSRHLVDAEDLAEGCRDATLQFPCL